MLRFAKDEKCWVSICVSHPCRTRRGKNGVPAVVVMRAKIEAGSKTKRAKTGADSLSILCSRAGALLSQIRQPLVDVSLYFVQNKSFL